MSKNFNEETVKSVHHWTDNLFSFTCTRDTGFRFLNGQFAMIGLMVDGRPLLRAYSLASANYEEDLEFFSIKVPNGPLTSRLQHLKVGTRSWLAASPPVPSSRTICCPASASICWPPAPALPPSSPSPRIRTPMSASRR